MIIRNADLKKDAHQIMEGARDFAKRTAFTSLFPEDDAIFIRAVGKIVTMDGCELLLAEHEDRIVGGIGLLFIPYQWNPELLSAEELFWWSATDAPHKTGYMLLTAAMQLIDTRNAIPIFRKLTTSPEGVEKMYLAHGLKPIETVYARAC